MSNFNKVGIFMKTFGQEVKSKPSFSTDKINKLRIDLIKEELDELKEAMDNNDELFWVTFDEARQFESKNIGSGRIEIDILNELN